MKKVFILGGTVIFATLIIVLLSKKDTSSTTSIKQLPIQKSVSKIEKGYVTFSKLEFKQNANKKRVYFFHAKWCPSCKTADQDFTDNLNSIPTNVILFKTDYDTESDLKKKYAITYQHTFVYVDSEEKEIKKWNGGGLIELISNMSGL